MKTRRDVFQAIADPTRRAILLLIAAQSMTPNAIAEEFHTSRQAVSKHIQILTECQLVKQEQRGREIYYHINVNKINEVDKWVERFKKILEAQFTQLDNVLLTLKKKEKMKSKIQEHQKENIKDVSKDNLPLDLTVDKATKTVLITREFDAGLSLVWDAFTKAEILDQWMAPKPWAARTKFMDFKVGGRRFYAMVSPEGHERWAVQKYTSISPKTNFKMFNAFADKDENPELPGSEWDYTFSEQNGKTTVRITIYNESLARLEKMIEMGFKEGFAMSITNLENLLATLSKK